MFDEWEAVIGSAIDGRPANIELAWVCMLDGKTWSNNVDALYNDEEVLGNSTATSSDNSGSEEEIDDFTEYDNININELL